MSATTAPPGTPPGKGTAGVPGGAVRLARRLARSERLRQRRYELLPLTGPGAAFTDVQGRAPDSATAPAELAELISSIATVGVLQPVLVEELPDRSRRLVAGERRVRAAKWGAAHQPDNPHFASIPAVVCPGPLTEADRRVWQLVENLARADLQPGELAAALLYERAAVLATKLTAAGVDVPADLTGLDDPVARYQALEGLRLRAGQHQLGAPWPEVLRRLGLQLHPRRVADMVRAFAALPPELSEEMDEAKITLATRMQYLRLDRGAQQAAAEIWAAVRARGRPELLTAAIRARLEHPQLDAAGAVDDADALHQAANDARREALRPPAAATDPPPTAAPADERVDAETLTAALNGLRGLLGALRAGATLAVYDAGSLRLYAEELLGRLPAPTGHSPAGPQDQHEPHEPHEPGASAA